MRTCLLAIVAFLPLLGVACSGDGFTESAAGGGGGAAGTGAGGTGGSVPDASDDRVVPDAGCPSDQKLCGDDCVPIADPSFGCSDVGCDPCKAPHVSMHACEQGGCVIDTCAPGWGNCNDTASDGCEADLSLPVSCGACDRDCDPGQKCDAGQCVDNCPPLKTDCSGACVDVKLDPDHCGDCDHACVAPLHAAAVCNAGTCGFKCHTTYTRCGEECFDLSSDVNHCGGCPVACQAPPGGVATCTAGECDFGCTSPKTRCGNACVDTQSDPLHCGTCPNVCPANGGQPTCVGGVCDFACAGSLTKCTTKCADTQTDINNCGTCGHVCVVPTGGVNSCVGGDCQPLCAPPQSVCNDACVNTLLDPNNCGICGKVCDEKPNATAICNNSVCGSECVSGSQLCGGACVLTQTDPKNCGWCGHDCKGQACNGGTCVPVTISTLTKPPTDIAVDPGSGATGELFITLNSTSVGTGEIVRMTKDGVTQTTAVSGLTNPNSIAIDGTRYYYANDVQVVQASRTGGLDLAIPAVLPKDVAVDGTRVYWVEAGDRSLRSAAKGNAAVANLGTPTSTVMPRSPRPDPSGTLVFFCSSNSGYIGTTNKTTAAITHLANSPSPAGQLALDDVNANWTMPASNQVSYMEKSSGIIQTLTTAEVQAGPIEAGGDLVVWATVSSAGRIRAWHKLSNAFRTYAVNQSTPCGVALDDEYVYWITCVAGGGAVRRVPR